MIQDFLVNLSFAKDIWKAFAVLLIYYILAFFISSKPFSKSRKGDFQYAYVMGINVLKALLYIISLVIIWIMESVKNSGEFEAYKIIIVVVLVINLIDSIKIIVEEINKQKKKSMETK